MVTLSGGFEVSVLNKVIYVYYSLTARLKKKYIKKIGADVYYKTQHRHANGFVIPADKVSKVLTGLIDSNAPFFAGRYGANEMNATTVFDLELKSKYSKAKNEMKKGAGFFADNDDDYKKFSDLMKESTALLDYVAVWNLPMEEYYLKRYAPKRVVMSRLRYFEPWYGTNPWTSALRGKKVLVIHPFVRTIRNQYEKRELLFDNPNILPEFELHTIKAVQTIARNKDERFDSWFDALEWMFNEAMQIDFDIALIGCGAYGFPLAAKLKSAGKKAIHMGGVLQILFGIKGARWDNDEVVSKMYNEYWVHPGEEEKPKNSKIVEGGCYW